jgi:hypothetical protein
MEKQEDEKYLKLSSADQMFFDDIVSALPDKPMTDEEFAKEQRIINNETPLKTVVTWLEQQDTQE